MRRQHPMEPVAAELTLRHGLEGIPGKRFAQPALKFEFLHFALLLLRALLRCADRVLQSGLEARDGLVFVEQLEAGRLLGILLGLFHLRGNE